MQQHIKFGLNYIHTGLTSTEYGTLKRHAGCMKQNKLSFSLDTRREQ